MKITRPPHVRSSQPSSKPAGAFPVKSKAFAEQLARAEHAPASAETVGSSAGAAAAKSASAVADIGAQLRAGRLSAEAAMDKVVETVLDRQLGKTAPPALRAQLAATLRESLTDDPMLAAKVRALSKE